MTASSMRSLHTYQEQAEEAQVKKAEKRRERARGVTFQVDLRGPYEEFGEGIDPYGEPYEEQQDDDDEDDPFASDRSSVAGADQPHHQYRQDLYYADDPYADDPYAEDDEGGGLLGEDPSL